MEQYGNNSGLSPDSNSHSGGEDASTSGRSHTSDKLYVPLPPAPPPASAPRVRRRNRMITSCLECRRRKLKCDKSQPCTNCTKSTRDCVFLAPALDSASQLKLTEIKEKMGSLERVLEQDVAMKGTRKGERREARHEEINFAPEPEDEKNLEPTPLAVYDAVYDDDADDDILDLGIQLGRLRLTERVGGFFRPKLSGELTVALTDARFDRRSQAEKLESTNPHVTTQDFMAPGPSYIAPTTSFFFNTGSNRSLIDFLPSKKAADRLLQQYWYTVHSIAMAVHRPSFEKRYETFWNEVQMGLEPVGSLQAVVFAALFSGAVSMSEDVILREFGASKRSLEDNFQQGTETALARANILRTTKVETLQAFVMYMIPLCRDQMSRAHSALCGTAIRLAECMGLHKDGMVFGLNPVETHVRRLIWYQLCFLDLRTCEAQGPRPQIRSDEYDTKLPLNVDEINIDQTYAPIEPQKCWTDMTIFIIRARCNEMHRQLWTDRLKIEKKQLSLTQVLGKIENFRRVTDEEFLPLMDENIPIQRAGLLIYKILNRRMHIMILHRYHNSVSQAIPDRLRQLILTSGTEQLEAAVTFETHPATRPYAWYAGALQQYHTAFLLLIDVFINPQRREADRIWTILDYVFEVPKHLSRDIKSRIILTELRDRLAVYAEARKVRAPTGMNEKLGLVPPRKAENLSQPSREVLLPQMSAQSQDPHAIQFLGKAGMGIVQDFYPESMPSDVPYESPKSQHSPVLQVPGYNTSYAQLTGIGKTSPSSFLGGITLPMPPGLGDENMVDIDWNEWDKLFPPDINTGEVGWPVFSGV